MVKRRWLCRKNFSTLLSCAHGRATGACMREAFANIAVLHARARTCSREALLDVAVSCARVRSMRRVHSNNCLFLLSCARVRAGEGGGGGSATIRRNANAHTPATRMCMWCTSNPN
eukprot:106731-Chlamydomonas_euryale.AAC.1